MSRSRRRAKRGSGRPRRTTEGDGCFHCAGPKRFGIVPAREQRALGQRNASRPAVRAADAPKATFWVRLWGPDEFPAFTEAQRDALRDLRHALDTAGRRIDSARRGNS